MALETDLVSDIGMHAAEDTDDYLAKGYRVVAVDASPDLCKAQAERPRRADRRGAPDDRQHRDHRTTGTGHFLCEPRGRSGGRLIASSLSAPASPVRVVNTEITVEGVEFGSLLDKHGTPWSTKIDIEGAWTSRARRGCVGALRSLAICQIESEKCCTWARLLHEFGRVHRTGLRPVQDRPPAQGPLRSNQQISRSGRALRACSASDAPGEWITAGTRPSGHTGASSSATGGQFKDFSPLRRNRVTKPLAQVLPLMGGPWWYDTHARHNSVG